MLAINWDDVAKVVNTIIPHIVAIVIALVAAVVVTVAAMKAPKGAKGLIRGSAWVAALLAVLIVVNLICTGPMATLLTQSLGKPVAKIDEATTKEATELVTEICFPVRKK